MEQSWPLGRDIGKTMLQYWNDGNSLLLQNAIHGQERRWELASSILSEILHLSKRTWLENGAWRWWYQWYPIYSYLQMLVFQPCLPHDKPGLIRSLPPIEPCAQVRRVGFSDPKKNGRYLEPGNQENSQPMEPPITWIFEEKCDFSNHSEAWGNQCRRHDWWWLNVNEVVSKK